MTARVAAAGETCCLWTAAWGVSLAAMATQSPRRHPNFHIRPEWNYFRQSVEVVVSRSDAELRSRSCSSIACSHVLVEVAQG